MQRTSVKLLIHPNKMITFAKKLAYIVLYIESKKW